MSPPSQSLTFTVVDGVVFGASLLVSAGIGVYYAIRGRHGQQTTSDYYVGNKKMSIFPVSLSLLASFISAIAVVGVPAEVYYYGLEMTTYSLSGFVAFPLACLVYLPVYHRLAEKRDVTSAYEYLELRFNKPVRILGTLVYVIMTFTYMAIVLYTPALALAQVTGISLSATIIVSGTVCTFYTTLGGMRAVVWTDALQMVILFAGLIAIVIGGLVSIGGFSNMWESAKRGGRDRLFKQVFGNGASAKILRYVNRGWNTKELLGKFMSICTERIGNFLTGCGAPVYSQSKQIHSILPGKLQDGEAPSCLADAPFITPMDSDIVPVFAIEMLSVVNGASGLFVAACYSAALSTVSSGVNSLAAVFLFDFIQPQYALKHGHAMSQVTATRVSKWLACGFGIASVGLSLLCQYLTSTVIRLANIIFAIAGGPLLGLFTLGILFPKVNSNGAASGVVSSLLIIGSIGIGSQFIDNRREMLPLSVAGCAFTNMSDAAASTASPANLTTNPFIAPIAEDRHWWTYLLRISHFYYALIAVIICIVVGVVVSAMTGNNKSVDPDLLFTPVTKLSWCMPPVRVPADDTDAAAKVPADDTDAAAKVVMYSNRE
ncbi:PREDICTED: sodium-coupled monocarboxylate transporter 1-like [Priapulus caudatus]|uniref:Sodium-coupled monocarboxylate transporter 1-like n=1 Tax=Priapulus caudatus TaxID=37621 RepID=A0ABM1ELE0_PRICU|nr:PREDICTED: sodium-coupled monocarboxylate transporter 1-like [Priapulus caudatus]